MNVLDVQVCINVFLGSESDLGIVARADVNGDGAVNILDVQAIVNAFLQGKDPLGSPKYRWIGKGIL